MSKDAASQVESNHVIYLEKYRTHAERDHHGETALMVDGEIRGYFPTASEAYIAGQDQHGLGNFSIQQVGAEPVALGAQTLALL